MEAAVTKPPSRGRHAEVVAEVPCDSSQRRTEAIRRFAWRRLLSGPSRPSCCLRVGSPGRMNGQVAGPGGKARATRRAGAPDCSANILISATTRLTRADGASRDRALDRPKGFLLGRSSLRRQTTHAAPPTIKVGLRPSALVTPLDGILPMPAARLLSGDPISHPRRSHA